MTPSASRSPKRLPSSCPQGRSQIDVRNGMRLRPARPPPALRLRRRPRGRHRARRSRLASSAYVHRQTASGRQRVTGPPGCPIARRPHIGGGDRPRRDRSATHAYRRPDARRRGLRATASRRMALRRAGPATWQRPVHGPVLSRLGRHGRYDSLSSDGNHVSRLISRPAADACRPRIMAMRRTLAPLPISIRTTCRPSSDRCEYTWPKAQHPSVWLSGQSPI